MENLSSDDDHYAGDDARELYSLPRVKPFDQPLSLEIDYLPTWNFRDCFREVCQNWADGMRESNNLGNKNFITEIHDTETRWLARALHPTTKVLIGYIRFQKRKGMIELTNFNAQLSRRTLNFGGGDKNAKPHLAKGKGEGYKAAAVVALKNGYHFRYEASSCYWRFHVGRDHPTQMYCHLKPVKPEALGKIAAEYTVKFSESLPRNEHNYILPRDEHNYIHKDVSVKIGSVYGNSGLKITEQVFHECINVSLDLALPSSMVTTPDGDLIMDDEFRDKTYLKRLLVEGNPGISQYKFGYHFYEGLIDRDRRRMPSPKKDASRVARIWHHAINKHPEFLSKYIDMIEDCATEWADVHLAKDYVSKEIAEKMAQYYFEKSPGQSIFYHDSRKGSKDVQIIIGSLKKRPQQLVPMVWDILRKYKLVRTPKEEQERLLRNAPEAQDTSTPYSKSLKRALMASLHLSPRTKHLQLSFRSGAEADFDLLLCGSMLNINEKWLDFRASHEKAPCALSLVSDPQFHDDDCFSCHHVVLQLHELILAELDRHNDGNDGLVNANTSLHQKVQDNLSQMPIMIEANATELPGEILISWEDLDAVSRMHKLRSQYRVTLHCEMTCSHMKDNLLTPDQPINAPPSDGNSSSTRAQTLAVCGCPERIALHMDGKALFHNLDPINEYFPMVARNDPQSFFGVPPNAVRPLSHSFQRPPRSPPCATRNTYTERENHVFQDFFNTDDDESDDLHAHESNSQAIVTGLKRHLQKIDSETKRLRGSLKVLKANLHSKEEELRAANLLVENLQTKDADTTKTISDLEAEVQELRASTKELEVHWATAQEIFDKRTKSGENRAPRMNCSSPVKREMNDEDKDETSSARGKKSARKYEL